jgi:tetratricopeptide (TPR) repeat protein
MTQDQTPTKGPVVATTAEPAVTPLSPPGYELCDEIGHGGMGVVYRARDVALDRDVAVKLLSQRYPAGSPAAQRFLSEARITGQLQHPGIPAVHQVGALADGRPFLAMKLIRGTTLADLLKHMTDPAAGRGRLLGIFEAVCQAVGYAHAHRVIHRDLKPANVMIGRFGEVQVMDWGLAKVLGEEVSARVEAVAAERTQAWTEIHPTPEVGSHTQAGSLVGTPAFIPPEQAVGQIGRVNQRSDVFGLGALLAVILTGKPPYVGDTSEAVRVLAVRGQLEDCFARLDASGAEPELVALCKKCLAFEPADRPADAGAVAQAVAGLRAAADERARRAELERVRLEGEQATAAARAAERRKRRRLALGAAAVLVVAALGGLSAVLAVQGQANADLAVKNRELDDERAKVEQRFELAQKAIALFHTGVSEDFLLKNKEFEALRTKLLKAAAGFYTDLEKLLAGQTDAKSRQALAAAYFQLGELTDKIGDRKEALAVHRQALELRRKLAAAEGADVETRLDVARSLGSVGVVLNWTGDTAGALAAHADQRDLAERLEAEHPTDTVRFVLAQCHLDIGKVHYDNGQLGQALPALRKALAIAQQLADANPGSTEFQSFLAKAHLKIGAVLRQTGQPEETLQALQKALAIWQKLAAADRAATEFQYWEARAHGNIAYLLLDTGRPGEALKEQRQALALLEKVAGANPAVNEFQHILVAAHEMIGVAQLQAGKPQEALEAHRKELAICRKLVADNPTVTEFQVDLAEAHNRIGWCLLNMGQPLEGAAESHEALKIMQLLVDDHPANNWFQVYLADSQTQIGRALDRQKQWPEALAALEKGLVIRQKLARADPNDAWRSRALGESHGMRGGARARAGQPAEAATDLRQALQLWAKSAPLDVEQRVERARAQALLAGLGRDARSGVTTEEARTFADQAVAALAATVKAGWALPSELKEPDFDALRGRADFQKLMAQVEARSKANAAKKRAESK